MAPITRRHAITATITLASLLTCTTSSQAQIESVRVATGLSFPMYATHAPGRPNELFILERGGAIKIMSTATGVINANAFLTIPDVDTTFEGGALGLAFHPDFDSNGKFYVHLTTAGAAGSALTSRVREYTVTNPLTGTSANTTPTQILATAQPQANHNGGWIGFKPNDTDANLYVMFGDGGNSYDSGTGHTAGTGNAQDITSNFLGKILRVNVDDDDFPTDPNANYAIPNANPFVGVTGDDEIFAYGLRNPFRASFDSLTGDLYIGDVGQGTREEIDLIPSASTGGENFGWRLREGNVQTPNVGGPEPADYAGPIYDYNSFGTGDFTGNSVTGGTLYRGPVAELYGKYVFADYQDNKIWSFDPADPEATVQRINTDLTPNQGAINSVVAVTEDAHGNLYFLDLVGGEIFRVGLPGDINADGFVGIEDLNVILSNWNQNVPQGSYFLGDITGIGDGFIGISDINTVLTHWNLGIPPAAAASNNASIPEPATFTVFGVSIWIAHTRRTRPA